MSSETIGHDEAIDQFCGVTGASEERAKGLLEACDWNLELAINMHVDTDSSSNRIIPTTGSRPTQARPDSPNSIVRSSSIQHRNQADNSESSRHPSDIITLDSDDVRPPIPPVRQVLVDGPMPTSSYGVSSSRFNSRSNHPVNDAFRDFQAETQWLETELNRDGEASAIELPAITSLDQLYRPPIDLMFRGSLISAREVGKQQNKWLLINVQSGQFACSILNRDLWSNLTVKDIIKDHFVFWQVYRDSADGGKYIQFYNVTNFPYVAIVDPRTGEQLKSWSSPIDDNTFCDSVSEFLAEHPSPDGTGDASSMKKLRLKEDDVATLYDQSEEAQLEAAIKASLQDAENSNSLSHNADDDDCEIETFDSDTEASRSSIDTSGRSKLNQQTNSCINNGQHTSIVTDSSSVDFTGLGRSCRELTEENASRKTPKIVEDYTKYLGIDSEQFSDLVLRFPDGTRDQLKFPADTQLKALFLFLGSRGYDSENYNYLTNFPRRNLQELCDTDSLQDVKLIKDTIYIERKVKDE